MVQIGLLGEKRFNKFSTCYQPRWSFLAAWRTWSLDIFLTVAFKGLHGRTLCSSQAAENMRQVKGSQDVLIRPQMMLPVDCRKVSLKPGYKWCVSQLVTRTQTPCCDWGPWPLETVSTRVWRMWTFQFLSDPWFLASALTNPWTSCHCRAFNAWSLETTSDTWR